jgi:hypothetical protein
MSRLARLTGLLCLAAAGWGLAVLSPPGLVSIAPAQEAGQGETKRSERVARPRSAALEMKRAREKLLECSSIQARIVETVAVADGSELPPRSYKAEGRYLQTSLKPGDWHMRLELVLKAGNAEGSLLEVCDGGVLWSRTQVDTGRQQGKRGDKDEKEQTVTRRNVNQILEAARKLGEESEAALVANMGLGGLPALLASLERDMRFGSVTEETLRDRPVYVLQGTWSERMASALRGRGEGGSALLPPFVPDGARLYLDRETGFPHRILYLKRIPGRNAVRPMLTLDFLNVVLNEPINPSEFLYTPPEGVKEVELTQYFLDRLTPPDAAGGPGAAPGNPPPQ